MADTAYAAFFKEVHDAQDARKASLEARAAALIAVSGTVVTILLALAGLATQSAATFSLTKDAQWYLYGALILLIVSAILAILGGIPLAYKSVLASGLQWIVDNTWDESEDNATLRIAATRAKNLAWNKRVNDFKALVLALALAVQIAAVVFMALAAWSVLSAAQLAP